MSTTQRGSFATALVDQTNVRRDGGHQIDWDKVAITRKPGVAYTVIVNGAAAAGATGITVQPLTVVIPAGTILDFGVHSTENTQMLAALVDTAEIGATSLETSPLPVEVEDTKTATYRLPTSDKRVIPPFTIMARLDSGKMIPRADVTAAEKAFAFLAAEAQEDRPSSSLSGQGVIIAGAFYENLLPDFGAADFGTYKTELADAGSFQYRTWADNSAG